MMLMKNSRLIIGPRLANPAARRLFETLSARQPGNLTAVSPRANQLARRA
jgi:hypothetical protein